MAEDLNTVALVGRLTRDVEVRQAGGTNALSMRLAVTSRKKVGETWTDVSNFFDVTHFSKAEGLIPLLTKGRQVAIRGRLAWREWESGDGTRRQAVEVVTESLQLLSEGKGAVSTVTSKASEGDDHNDIPF